MFQGFGCDGVMDSGMVYDKCGVCNGTDSGCQRVFGKYSSNSATVKCELIFFF